MTQDQDRKMEVLKFTDQLRTAGVTNGNGQLLAEMATKDVQNRLSSKTQHAIQLTNRVCRLTLIPQKLGDLLEGFAPEGYEDGEGGHGTITFDLQTGKIRVEHNWYEIVSNPADPREI